MFLLNPQEIEDDKKKNEKASLHRIELLQKEEARIRQNISTLNSELKELEKKKFALQ